MDSWQQFLQQQGAQFHNGQLTGFGEQPNQYADLLDSTVLFHLDNMTTMALRDGAVKGGSHKLLQGQVTCNLDDMTNNKHLFGAHCTPKGRAIANFYLFSTDSSQATLLLPKEQLVNVTNSLNKYAPFFRVSLQEGNTIVLALAGANAYALCQQAMGDAPRETGQCTHSAAGSALCIDTNRLLLLIDQNHSQTIWQQLQKDAHPAGPELWSLLDIRAGIGHIQAATSEEFIPQMLNMQAVYGTNSAINFKKGCYTGQEVIARMHYLGKLKRRMYRLQVSLGDNTITAGDLCYIAEKSQSQGNIVSIAPSGSATVELLAVLTDVAAASSQMAFGPQQDNAPLLDIEQLPLPYSLDA